jgi:FKBP-type peptidyl-prolyl cis-trans isomerase SlyD
MNFIAGYGQVLPSLEQELIGLEQGAQKEVTIPARDGFGEREPSLVQTMAFSEFPQGRDLEPGKWAMAKNESTGARYSYFVSEKTASTITVDYNHPLAGRDLHYFVNVILVRPALPEELEYLRPCEHGQETKN